MMIAVIVTGASLVINLLILVFMLGLRAGGLTKRPHGS